MTTDLLETRASPPPSREMLLSIRLPLIIAVAVTTNTPPPPSAPHRPPPTFSCIPASEYSPDGRTDLACYVQDAPFSLRIQYGWLIDGIGNCPVGYRIATQDRYCLIDVHHLGYTISGVNVSVRASGNFDDIAARRLHLPPVGQSHSKENFTAVAAGSNV